MYHRKNIAPFLISTLAVISVFMLSFYIPKAQNKTSVGSFKISEVQDRTVSVEEQIITFETYDLKTIHTIRLVISGTYGSIVLIPKIKNGQPIFSIPPTFTKYAGSIAFYLIQHEKVLQDGVFNLLPKTTEIGLIENYLGPRSIVANDRDHTMLVSIPTDIYDNLLPDSMNIEIKTQFKNTITISTKELTSGFAWKRIPAPLVTGRISTGSTLGDVSSKELVADIFPDVAQDFSISVNSNHSYADGNEIISLQTTQIKDKRGNIMTDGTLVSFMMTDETGAYWQTNTTTVNGFAFAKTLHPQTPTTWKISATISGIASSQEINQTFVSILDTIPVMTLQNRQVLVGPLTSYLGQLVQDGIIVSFQIDGATYTKLTTNGKVSFDVKQEDHPKGNYNVIIQTLGLETTQNISLD